MSDKLDKYDVNELIRKQFNQSVPDRYCPECKQDMPMLMFTVPIPGSLRNTLFGKTIDETARFRCVGCLTLWDEFEGKMSE